MPTKPIERLLFAQGDKCFFCHAPLQKAEATVEHLVPLARGGSNADDNCVACCWSINALLGSMSIKEKIRVVLNQKGDFKCPNGAGTVHAVKPAPSDAAMAPAPAPAATPVVADAPAAPKKKTVAKKPADPVSVLVENLKSRGKGRPAKLKALFADIKTQRLGRDDAEVMSLVEKLKALGKIEVSGTKVTYKL